MPVRFINNEICIQSELRRYFFYIGGTTYSPHAKLASLRLSEETAEYAGLIMRVTESRAEVYRLMNKSMAARQLSLIVVYFNTAANSVSVTFYIRDFIETSRIVADRDSE